jgi:hypothetical protein
MSSGQQPSSQWRWQHSTVATLQDSPMHVTILNAADLSAAYDELQRETLSAIAEARDLTQTLPRPFTVDFITSVLSEPEIERVLDALPRRKHNEKKAKSIGFLYVFEQKEGCPVARAKIVEAMDRAKHGRGDKAKAIKNLCSVNSNVSVGKVLYVGRSWDPRTRIGGHLRASDGRTYAIHFGAWAEELNMEVALSVYAFPGVTNRVLQVVEDVVWDMLNPLFGRRGEK